MLAQLRSIVQAVNQDQDLPTALRNLVSNIKKAMSTDCCSVYLNDTKRNCLRLMATDGLSKSAVGKLCLNHSEGLIGLVASREEPLNIINAKTHPKFKFAPEVREEAYHAFLGVPVIHQKRLLGILSVQQKKARQFSEEEVSFLVTLSAQLASVLLHAEVRESLRETQIDDDKKLVSSVTGIPGSTGLAIGTAYIAHPAADFESISVKKVYSSENETRKFYDAVKATRQEFRQMAARLVDQVPKDTMLIFDVYQQMLDSNGISKDVKALTLQGWCAISALKILVERYVTQFEAMEDSYIQERATDVKDLGRRVLRHLLHSEQQLSPIPEKAILVAEEVTASMLAEIPRHQLFGVVSVKGSANSHSAIMARALGVPAVMGVEDIPLMQLNKKTLIINGYNGHLMIAPPQTVIKEYQSLIDDETAMQQEVAKDESFDAVSLDGYRIALMLNAGLGSDIEFNNREGCDGVGLYRTEYPYMIRKSFPSETELYELYKAFLSNFANKPVTMRTLDVGGDKTLPYFTFEEENPFLGWRGIRLTLDHPELFLTQVRAMLRANLDTNNLRIMLPMITNVREVDESLSFIEQAWKEITEEYGDASHTLTRPDIGIMIEVPSCIYLLDHLATRIDFCSVGSNDLTQYLLAVDRNNARVAGVYDSFNPAVLRALQEIMDRSTAHCLPTSVCGELAGTPGGALLLCAMGYRQLSMTNNNLARVKWMLRRLDLQECIALKDRCLTMCCPDEVRATVNQFIEEKGFGGLIRAGR